MYLKQLPDGLVEQSVFLDGGEGTELTGHVGGQDATPTALFSSTATISGAQGNAVIKGADNLNYADLTFEIQDGWSFGDLQFDINIDQTSLHTEGTGNDKVITDLLRVTAYDGAVAVGTYDGFLQQAQFTSGENTILTLAATTVSFTSIVVQALLADGTTLTNIIADMKLFGVSGAQEQQIGGPPPPVPIPGALQLFVGGLGLVAWLGRRRNGRPA
jgi:hypothetical protein